MITKSRITAILQTNNLDASIIGLPSFNLSDLDLPVDLDFPLPTNLRLGHLAEAVVSEAIKVSDNYDVLYENVQLIDKGRTIGEIDFIIENRKTKRQTHVELAYKFYLYDPMISAEPINNWIGPNRNDSLSQKLVKVRNTQFPLLQHDIAHALFSDIEIGQVDQALCLLVSLFIPFGDIIVLDPAYQRAVKGYYLDIEEFRGRDHSDKFYYIPSKKEWGMDPSENMDWTTINKIETKISINIDEKQAPLVWQKYRGSYSAFFIVWW